MVGFRVYKVNYPMQACLQLLVLELGTISLSRLVQERWARFRGLPLHLWTMNIFMELRMAFGGSREVDPLSLQLEDCRWVRVKVGHCDLA